MSMLFAAARRVAKELLYTAGAVVVLLSAYHGFRAWFWPPSDPQDIESVRKVIAGYPLMSPGKRLVAHGVDFGKHAYSFLVITSPACAFCVRSAPFHRTMLAASRERAVPLFIVVPTPRIARSFLSAAGLQGAEAIGYLAFDRKPQGVPSVVLVNSQGMIRRIWLGELTSAEQSEVLTAIGNPSNVTSPLRKLDNGEAMLTPRDLHALSTEEPVTIISLQERDSFKVEHPAGALNIPLEELSQRASSELRVDRLYAVDCTTVVDMVCSVAVRHLRALGFRSSPVDFGWVGENQ